jgi:hypothetical protein
MEKDVSVRYPVINLGRLSKTAIKTFFFGGGGAAAQGLLILKVSRSLTATHHSR